MIVKTNDSIKKVPIDIYIHPYTPMKHRITSQERVSAMTKPKHARTENFLPKRFTARTDIYSKVAYDQKGIEKMMIQLLEEDSRRVHL